MKKIIILSVVLCVVGVVIYFLNNINLKEKGEKKMANFYDFSVTTAKDEEVKMSDFKGKVVLIVNTATGCGFTPQYAPIEQMYKDYNAKGLEILDIPCNQFGAQAPGTDEEIHDFCTIHYNTTFPQMKKSDVNGDNQLPLYKYLKEQQGFKGFGESKMAQFMKQHLLKIDPNYENNSDIKWNFTKFVVDKNGNVVARFEPTEDMETVKKCIKELL